MAFNGTRERVKSATREASNRVKAELSLLPEKPQCDKCGGLMETSSADDPREGAFYDRYPRVNGQHGTAQIVRPITGVRKMTT